MANLLIATGRLTDEEATQIWEALILLDLVADRAGLDGWDCRPPAAPPEMVKAAVDVTRVLAGRAVDRCEALSPRAGMRCIHRKGHPGSHRAKA